MDTKILLAYKEILAASLNEPQRQLVISLISKLPEEQIAAITAYSNGFGELYATLDYEREQKFKDAFIGTIATRARQGGLINGDTKLLDDFFIKHKDFANYFAQHFQPKAEQTSPLLLGLDTLNRQLLELKAIKQEAEQKKRLALEAFAQDTELKKRLARDLEGLPMLFHPDLAIANLAPTNELEKQQAEKIRSFLQGLIKELETSVDQEKIAANNRDKAEHIPLAIEIAIQKQKDKFMRAFYGETKESSNKEGEGINAPGLKEGNTKLLFTFLEANPLIYSYLKHSFYKDDKQGTLPALQGVQQKWAEQYLDDVEFIAEEEERQQQWKTRYPDLVRYEAKQLSGPEQWRFISEHNLKNKYPDHWQQLQQLGDKYDACLNAIITNYPSSSYPGLNKAAHLAEDKRKRYLSDKRTSIDACWGDSLEYFQGKLGEQLKQLKTFWDKYWPKGAVAGLLAGLAASIAGIAIFLTVGTFGLGPVLFFGLMGAMVFAAAMFGGIAGKLADMYTDKQGQANVFAVVKPPKLVLTKAVVEGLLAELHDMKAEYEAIKQANPTPSKPNLAAKPVAEPTWSKSPAADDYPKKPQVEAEQNVTATKSNIQSPGGH